MKRREGPSRSNRAVMAIIGCLFLLGALPGYARTLYVDPDLGSARSGRYDPAARRCGSGSETAMKDLATGLSVLQPGDTIILRAGSYGGTIVPPTSGIDGRPVTIKAYPGEKPIVTTPLALGITMDRKAFITIEGLSFSQVGGFGHIYDCNSILFRNCSFSGTIFSGTTGALKFARSTHCKILNSTFRQGASDLLILQDNSDRNIVEGNVFDGAGHSLMSVRCSNFNIVRSNTFRNPKQKALEIYDCEGVSDAPVRLDATKRNLFEANAFVHTAASDRIYKFNAIQHGGQFTIVRRNVFLHCEGGGVNYQSYPNESIYVYKNRLYNNTFYHNRCYAVIGNSGDGSQYFDNVVKNNLLYRNADCSGGGRQIHIEDPSAVLLSGNALAIVDPEFVNELANDMHLVATSPHVDEGAFITRTAEAGSGTSLRVADAGYFTDGFGIPGESGDMVQLQGQPNSARILAIEYATHTLTLDTPLDWSAGQGLHLAYSGRAPDIGAFELGRLMGGTSGRFPSRTAKIAE